MVEDGLGLIAEREAKLAELRQSLEEALADPRRYTPEEVKAHLRQMAGGLYRTRPNP